MVAATHPAGKSPAGRQAKAMGMEVGAGTKMEMEMERRERESASGARAAPAGPVGRTIGAPVCARTERNQFGAGSKT